MMDENSKAANAVGGRTARACDSCLRRRARWFCAADDAFLCQSCDASVHGANQLAGRHVRVRLRSSSFKVDISGDGGEEDTTPTWHRGFTRKARTPRRHNHRQQQQQVKDDGADAVEMALDSFLADPPLPFVPEMSSEEDQHSPTIAGEIDEEQLLYQVPVFNPFAIGGDEKYRKAEPGKLGQQQPDDEFDDHQISGFLDSELNLAEFAADVESLLGVEDKSCQLDDILLDFKEEEEEEEEDFDVGIDIDIDFGPRVVKVEEDDQSILGFRQNPNPSSSTSDDRGNGLLPETPNKTDILLTLNYEAVIAAWDEQGSPWMTGIRPNVKPEHGWPVEEMWPADYRRANGEWPGLVRNGLGHNTGGGREARVSRYREKRRTRLFSKKIRYEVRKLNAEKRPRMKGRFVKRSSTASFTGQPNNNHNPTMIATSTYPHIFHEQITSTY